MSESGTRRFERELGKKREGYKGITEREHLD